MNTATIVLATYMDTDTPCVRLRCDRCMVALISAVELPADDLPELIAHHRCGEFRLPGP